MIMVAGGKDSGEKKVEYIDANALDVWLEVPIHPPERLEWCLNIIPFGYGRILLPDSSDDQVFILHSSNDSYTPVPWPNAHFHRGVADLHYFPMCVT